MKTKVIYSNEQIAQKTEELAQVLSEKLQEDELVVVGVLKSGVLFYADLIRKINRPLTCDFIETSEEQSLGKPLSISLDLTQSLLGKQVILADVFLEQGERFHFLRDRILQENPSRLITCCLWTDEPSPVDIFGFKHPHAKKLRGYGRGEDHRNRFQDYVSLEVEDSSNGTS